MPHEPTALNCSKTHGQFRCLCAISSGIVRWWEWIKTWPHNEHEQGIVWVFLCSSVLLFVRVLSERNASCMKLFILFSMLCDTLLLGICCIWVGLCCAFTKCACHCDLGLGTPDTLLLALCGSNPVFRYVYQSLNVTPTNTCACV
jgi:hypothetical protein